MAKEPNYIQNTTDKIANTRHNESDEVLTVKEAEHYFKIGHNTMSDLLISKRLGSFKVKGCRRISKSAIEKFIKEAEEEAKYEQ